MQPRKLVRNAAPEDTLTARYGLICKLAQRQLWHEGSRNEFQPSELAHEAYMRIVASGFRSNRSHSQFCKITSRIIQNILVDEARKRKTQKRGANVQVLQLDEVWSPSPEKTPEELLALHEDLVLLHEILDRLGRIDPQKRQVVELLFFEECTFEEIATKLGLCVSTVKIHWNLAKVWIRGHFEYRRNRRVAYGLEPDCATKHVEDKARAKNL